MSHFEAYLAHRRDLGLKLTNDEPQLRSFARFADQISTADHLTVALAVAWARALHGVQAEWTGSWREEGEGDPPTVSGQLDEIVQQSQARWVEEGEERVRIQRQESQVRMHRLEEQAQATD